MTAPAIVLLSDFGLADPYVAEMKAAILVTWRRYPDVAAPPPLVDLSHDVPPGDVAEASRLLARSASRFPTGTVFAAVVDPGVGTDRPAVALRTHGRIYVAPGNGLLRGVPRGDDAEIVRLDRDVYHLDGAPPSATFHGRDVFATAAAHLARGVPQAQLGTPGGRDLLGEWPAMASEPGVLARIVRIDRFGNALTDLRRDSDAGRALAGGGELSVGGIIATGPMRTYGDALPGELFWYWGSGDELELALRDDSAARVLDLKVGMALRDGMP